MIPEQISRRHLLLTAAGLGAISLAGCGKADPPLPDGKNAALRFSIVAP